VNPALFVAGTDTGVGKTHVAMALCRALRSRGLRVGVMKPAETGCHSDAPPDALALIEASGCRAPLDLVCPYRFADPLAPGVAAECEGRTVDILRLDAALAELRSSHDVVVCEGAGGLLVPLAGTIVYADWLESTGLPVLLVGRLGLGTLNHVLLSARYLAARGIPHLATVLSATQTPADLAETTNPGVLARYPESRIAGVLAHGLSPEFPQPALDVIIEWLKGQCR
jgi:dethiobiotin synthetase